MELTPGGAALPNRTRVGRRGWGQLQEGSRPSSRNLERTWDGQRPLARATTKTPAQANRVEGKSLTKGREKLVDATRPPVTTAGVRASLCVIRKPGLGRGRACSSTRLGDRQRFTPW